MELQQLPLPGGKLNTLRVFRSASVRHESQGRGAEVTDFGDFPPAFHALLFTYNLSYRATSGQWNPLWSGNRPMPALPPAGGIVVATASGKKTNDLPSSWKFLVEDCAAVFGGAIGGDFPRIPPFPYFNSSIEAPQLAQYFLQDSVNAEAITALLGDSFLVPEAEARLFPSRKTLYDSPWIGMSFRASSFADEVMPNVVAMELEVQWFDYSTFRETASASSLLLADDNLQIDRRAWDEGHGLFSVATAVHNPATQPSQVRCLEVVPDQYDLLVHTFSVHSLQQSQHVADLPSFQWSRSCSAQTSASFHCGRVLSFDLWLPANETVELRFQAKKRIANIFFIPPDASRGLEIPPLFLATSDGQTLYSSPLLLSAPIPDLSMPYTVYTLISTLFAFLLGSIINIYVRRLKPPAPTDAASNAAPSVPEPPSAFDAQ